MKYLGLDQAPSVIGYAIGVPDAEPIADTFKVPGFGDCYGRTLQGVSRWLEGLVAEHQIGVVCFESPYVPRSDLPPKKDGKRRPGISPQIVRRMCSLADHIDFACAELGIKCLEIENNVWRRHFIGRGTAPKEIKGSKRTQWLKDEAKKTCRARGWPVKNDHEAEACGILDYLLACQFPEYGARSGLPLLEDA